MSQIDCTQVQYWMGGGMVKCVQKKKSVAGQFEVKYKDDMFCLTKN